MLQENLRCRISSLVFRIDWIPVFTGMTLKKVRAKAFRNFASFGFAQNKLCILIFYFGCGVAGLGSRKAGFLAMTRNRPPSVANAGKSFSLMAR